MSHNLFAMLTFEKKKKIWDYRPQEIDAPPKDIHPPVETDIYTGYIVLPRVRFFKSHILSFILWTH